MTDAIDYDRCKTCGEFGWLSTHKCPPAWLVWQTDNGGTERDARRVRARDAELAAEKWAEEDDCYGDYTIIGGSEATVHVRKDEEGAPIEVYVVDGESVPQYHAKRVEPKTP